MKYPLTTTVSAIILSGCANFNFVSPADEPAAPKAVAIDSEVVEIASDTAPEIELDAIVPEAEAISVGLAGSDPADIGRYLLARGASAPRISPNGVSIAYRSNLTGVPQVWVLDIGTGQSRQLTFGNGVTFFRWAPDSLSLIYGADNDGNEQEAYYKVSADGSDETLLLPASEGGFRSFGGISTDGKTAVFASTERNGIDFDIYTADLETAETVRVLEGTFGYFARALSPDGTKLIVTETVGEDSDNLYLLDLSSGDLETLSKPESRANHSDAGFAWLADSSGFYFATNRSREFTTPSFYDLASGAVEVVVDEGRDVLDINLCSAEQRYLAYTENVDGFEILKILDRGSGTYLETPDLPEGTYTLSCGMESDILSIGINGWRTPGDIYALNLATGDTKRVFGSNYAGLDADRLVRPESVSVTARDGVELQGLLYLPETEGDELPAVIFQVHGGPTGQSRANFDPVAQYHVDRGLAVFEPNVRGSLGFGRTYVTLDDREKRRDSVRDLVDLLDGLRVDGRVDVDRAAVTGGSYGGYMVNAVLALYPDAFKAGVSLFGVSDWVTALQVASPALKASDRIEYGDITEQEWIDFYTENSPIRLADQINVPVLFSHGVMDPRIDIAETEVMVRALRANGIDAPFIRIPDEGHGWRKMKNRLFYFRRQAEFLEAQLAE